MELEDGEIGSETEDFTVDSAFGATFFDSENGVSAKSALHGQFPFFMGFPSMPSPTIVNDQKLLLTDPDKNLASADSFRAYTSNNDVNKKYDYRQRGRVEQSRHDRKHFRSYESGSPRENRDRHVRRDRSAQSNKDDSTVDEDYELLLVRHHLIQQQLGKITAAENAAKFSDSTGLRIERSSMRRKESHYGTLQSRSSKRQRLSSKDISRRPSRVVRKSVRTLRAPADFWNVKVAPQKGSKLHSTIAGSPTTVNTIHSGSQAENGTGDSLYAREVSCDAMPDDALEDLELVKLRQTLLAQTRQRKRQSTQSTKELSSKASITQSSCLLEDVSDLDNDSSVDKRVVILKNGSSKHGDGKSLVQDALAFDKQADADFKVANNGPDFECSRAAFSEFDGEHRVMAQGDKRAAGSPFLAPELKSILQEEVRIAKLAARLSLSSQKRFSVEVQSMTKVLSDQYALRSGPSKLDLTARCKLVAYKTRLLEQMLSADGLAKVAEEPMDLPNSTLSLNHDVIGAEQKSDEIHPVQRCTTQDLSAEHNADLKILKQHEAKAAQDDYDAVPMDIEDEAPGYSDVAPLPLIEELTQRPPLPGDAFEPVPDQAAMSMTPSNVAWMPGYIESIDEERSEQVLPAVEDLNNCDSGVEKGNSVDSESFAAFTDDAAEDEVLGSDTKGQDVEQDVWALRAQALKSLACKRAAKAKAKNLRPEVSMTLSPSPLAPTGSSSVPLPPATSASSKSGAQSPAVNIQKKVNELPRNSSFTLPPRHAPIIIHLGPDDFPAAETASRVSSVVTPVPKTARKPTAKTLLKLLNKCLEDVACRSEDHIASLESDQQACFQLQEQVALNRTLFRQHEKRVALLRSQLKAAMAEKWKARDEHNRLYERMRAMKEQIQRKVKLRHSLEEESRRAKSVGSALVDFGISSTSTDQENVRGKGNGHLLYQGARKSIGALRELYLQMDKEILLSRLHVEAADNERGAEKTLPVELAIPQSIQNMSKEKLALLELELREKLKKYRAKLNLADNATLSDSSDGRAAVRQTLPGKERIDRPSGEALSSSPGMPEPGSGKPLNVPYVFNATGADEAPRVSRGGKIIVDPDNVKTATAVRQADLGNDAVVNLKRKQDGKPAENYKAHTGMSISLERLAPCALHSLRDLLCMDARDAVLPPLFTNVTDHAELQADEGTRHVDSDVPLSEECEGTVYMKYRSVLTNFRSYRLNPYFRTQGKLSIHSPTYTHKLVADQLVCRYDLLGTCNDSKCKHQHLDSVTNLSPKQVVSSLVQYDRDLLGVATGASPEDLSEKVDQFAGRFLEQYAKRMPAAQLYLLLLNVMKEAQQSRGQAAYHSVHFPAPSDGQPKEEPGGTPPHGTKSEQLYHLKKRKVETADSDGATLLSDESQVTRYFSEKYSACKVLEASVVDNPKDVTLWLALARHRLVRRAEDVADAPDTGVTQGSSPTREADRNSDGSGIHGALGVLSEALEINKDSEELWVNLLTLFAKVSSAEELRELCYQSVMFCPTYRIWWTCLLLEAGYREKQEICSELVKFVCGSHVDGEHKSHQLLEAALYAGQLLVARGRTDLARKFLAGACSVGGFADEDEKLDVPDLVGSLTVGDLSVLLLCRISVASFGCLPRWLFSDKTCPSKVVNKGTFVLPWNEERTTSDEETRAMFEEAAEILKSGRSRAFPFRLNQAMLLYENFVTFELACNNIQSAVNLVRRLVTDEPGFVEGWALLLLIYIRHSPMDVVVKIAEEAIHKCDLDVEIVYIYAEWLMRKGMPILAQEKLTNCIHKYFDFEQTDHVPDVLLLYKKILGLPVPYSLNLTTYIPASKTSHLIYYYWRSYCLLLAIKNERPAIATYGSAVEEAYESATHQFLPRDNVKKLWLAYVQWKIEHTRKLPVKSSKSLHALLDLLYRAVVAVPTSCLLPQSKGSYTNDFLFHNELIDLVVREIPVARRSGVYRKCLSLMADNVDLAVRVCEHELSMGNGGQVQIICAALLQDAPNNTKLWQMAIQLEFASGSIKEARWLHEEATKRLPYQAHMWSNFIEFEAKHGQDDEAVKNRVMSLVAKASQYGVDLKDVADGILSKRR